MGSSWYKHQLLISSPVGEKRTQLTVLEWLAKVPTWLTVGLSVLSCLTCRDMQHACMSQRQREA